MSEKELNRKALETLLPEPFFMQPYFTKYFADEFEIFFPYAPFGMPQYFDYWEAERCFEWLNRTVRKTENTLEHLYSTADPHLFWAVGYWNANVYWGNQNGFLSTLYVMQITIKSQKITKVKVQANPEEFLKAAGRKIPLFRMDMEDPAVDDFISKSRLKKKTDSDIVRTDQRDSDQRFTDNIGAMFCGVDREKYRALESYTEDFLGGAVFTPGEMQKYVKEPFGLYSEDCHPAEERERAHAWMKASSPWYYRNPRGRIYSTDERNVFFVECQGQGPSNWRGNNCDGHYHQAYFFYAKFAEDGRLAKLIEVINPMNKYNGCNIEVPSFPYYL